MYDFSGLCTYNLDTAQTQDYQFYQWEPNFYITKLIDIQRFAFQLIQDIMQGGCVY